MFRSSSTIELQCHADTWFGKACGLCQLNIDMYKLTCMWLLAYFWKKYSAFLSTVSALFPRVHAFHGWTEISFRLHALVTQGHTSRTPISPSKSPVSATTTVSSFNWSRDVLACFLVSHIIIVGREESAVLDFGVQSFPQYTLKRISECSAHAR